MIALMPHGSCFLWDPWLTALHVISDSLILLAYFSIPLLLLLHRRHIDPQLRPIIVLFAAFIFSCGIGHGLRVWNTWHANYWLEGGWSWLTATVSLYTAWQLRGLVPQMLSTHRDLIVIRELVDQDPLTGIANRRGLETALNTLAQLPGVVHTLALIDLDGFKSINDTCGHDAGDRLLQAVAEVLRQHSRAVDQAARIGGDEFALVLVGCFPREAQPRVEQIRRHIETLRLPEWDDLDSCPLVSASIGLSELRGDRGLTQSYQQADKALYRAKHSGKNQVHIFPAAQDMQEETLSP